MGADDRYWDREQLYEEVWTTPMRTLGLKYGISDVGLAKVCRKLSIPLPGRGHWARIAAGHAIRKPPLLPLKVPINLEKPAPRVEPPKIEVFSNEPERAQIEKLERTDAQAFLRRGDLSHPLVVQTREVLKHAQVENRQILITQEPCLDIRVSKAGLDRALRIMATLIHAIESEGFSIAVGPGHREKTVVKIHGQGVTFGLVEKVERVELAAPPEGGVLQRVLSYGGTPVEFTPTGRFSLEVWHPWRASPKRWKDGKTLKLEDLIPQILAGFIRIALAERNEQEQREAARREQQRREEERAHLQHLIRQEEARTRALMRAVLHWLRASQLRSFLSAARDAALQAGQSVDSGTPFGAWLKWAEEQADRMDPLKQSPASIVDREQQVEPERYTYQYGHTKPEPPVRFPKPIWKIDS